MTSKRRRRSLMRRIHHLHDRIGGQDTRPDLAYDRAELSALQDLFLEIAELRVRIAKTLTGAPAR